MIWALQGSEETVADISNCTDRASKRIICCILLSWSGGAKACVGSLI